MVFISGTFLSVQRYLAHQWDVFSGVSTGPGIAAMNKYMGLISK